MMSLASSTVMSFNPHTHEGCDLQRLAKNTEPESFNPHTHEGCDVAGW